MYLQVDISWTQFLVVLMFVNQFPLCSLDIKQTCHLTNNIQSQLSSKKNIPFKTTTHTISIILARCHFCSKFKPWEIFDIKCVIVCLYARKEGDTPVLPTRSTIPRNSVYKYANCRQLSANKTAKEMALCLFRFGYIQWLVLINVLSYYVLIAVKKGSTGGQHMTTYNLFHGSYCYCLHKMHLLCVWECMTFKFIEMLSFVSRQRYAYRTRFCTNLSRIWSTGSTLIIDFKSQTIQR